MWVINGWLGGLLSACRLGLIRMDSSRGSLVGWPGQVFRVGRNSERNYPPGYGGWPVVVVGARTGWAVVGSDGLLSIRTALAEGGQGSESARSEGEPL